jgi:hypothetical protein
MGGDVQALAVIAGGKVYITDPPQGDHAYITLEDACKSLGYKRERYTGRAVRQLEIMIANGRREGWNRFRAAVADLWPGQAVITFRAQTDDGYYRLIYVDGRPQVQSAGGHREMTKEEWVTAGAEAALDAASAEAAKL